MKTRWTFIVPLLVACHPAIDRSGELYTAGAQPAERLPLIVVLHGYGGSPQQIARLLDGFDVRARVFAPHGSFRVAAGWGWFSRSWDRGPDELAKGITTATDTIARQIATELATRPTCGAPIVAGFSQGGFLSYALAARTPAIVGAAFPIGGFLPPSLEPTAPLPSPPRVEAFQGVDDHVIELSWARHTYDRFAAAGFPGTLHVYPGVGHALVPAVVRDVREALTRAIQNVGCAP